MKLYTKDILFSALLSGRAEEPLGGEEVPECGVPRRGAEEPDPVDEPVLFDDRDQGQDQAYPEQPTEGWERILVLLLVFWLETSETSVHGVRAREKAPP